MGPLNGFVKIHRKLIQWGWYTDNVVKGVFIHILLTASFKEMAWQGRKILPGQLIASASRIGADLGFSRQQVRTALSKLESTGEIIVETTNKYTIITVTNWDEYQRLDEETKTRKSTSKKATKNPANKPFFKGDVGQANQHSNHQATSRFDEQIVNKKVFVQNANQQNNHQNCAENAATAPNFESNSKIATSSVTIEQPTSNQQITNKQPHRKKSKYLKDTYSDRENKEKKESAASAPLEADPRSRETEAEKADRLRREALRR